MTRNRRLVAGEGGPRGDGGAAELLLAWYDQHARRLPWRESADPYRVWVSEIMLQQTRVETVIPYFERWLQRFPDVRTLAGAPEEAVLKAWEGLGYYRRARNLHRAARLLVERYDAALPADFVALRKLPGIGEYTAGAIASIAFGACVPAVDGNVRRVLSRLFDLPDPSPASLRQHAAALAPAARPGDFNQALMELGATVCVPRNPACAGCPLADRCLALARGTRHDRPRARPAKRVPEFDVACAVLLSPDDRLLLTRRPDDGLLGGLWAFPETEIGPGETPGEAARRLADGLLGEEGDPMATEEGDDGGEGRAAPLLNGETAETATAADRLTTVRHAFTHKVVRYHAVRLRLGPASHHTRPTAGSPSLVAESRADYVPGAAATRDDAKPFRWFTFDEAARLPLPVAQRKILRHAATPAT